MREKEGQSELQRLVEVFDARVSELRRYFSILPDSSVKLRPGDAPGLRFEGFGQYIDQLETMVDTQLVHSRGSEAQIKEATKLVDEAIAEMGRLGQKRPWSGAIEYLDWVEKVKKLAGSPFER